MKITITIEPDSTREAADVLEALMAVQPTRTVDKLADARARGAAMAAHPSSPATPPEAVEAVEESEEQEPVEAPAPRRRRRTKAEMEAARAAEAAKAAEQEDEDEDEDEGGDSDEDDDLLGGDEEYTKEDVIARATELIDSNETPKVRKALAEAGVRKVTELKPEQFAAFMSAVS